MKEIYLAVLSDRHEDDTYKAFRSLDAAILCCNAWTQKEYYSNYEFKKSDIAGWEFYASAGDDRPSVHVEKILLDETLQAEGSHPSTLQQPGRIKVSMKVDIERIERLTINGLRTDGPHHKQWYLEQILKEIVSDDEFEFHKDTWEEGIPP